MTEKITVTNQAEAEELLRKNLSKEGLEKLALKADEGQLQLLATVALGLSWEQTMDNPSKIALSSFAIDHRK